MDPPGRLESADDAPELFDLSRLDEFHPFEIDHQESHLWKHVPLGVPEIKEVWEGSPLFYEAAHPPAHWMMVGEFEGQVLQVPLAPSSTGDETKCRPIGCYPASNEIAKRYRRDTATRRNFGR